MTYQRAIAHLNSFINFERLPEPHFDTREKDIDDFRKMLHLLGNPHHDYPVIHIAGTKGKGSTAVLLSSILAAAGYKVGLYTSPHLVSVRERIRINACMVSKREFAALIQRINRSISESELNLRTAYRTVFEHLTAAAMLHFSRQKVDVGIFEAGLGGKLDATIVLSPILSIITPIGLDHTTILGDTISEISADKAYIIKPNIPVVSSQQAIEAKQQITKRSEDTSSPLYFAPGHGEFDIIESNFKSQTFKSSRDWLEGNTIKLNLAGQFQLDNLSTVFESIEILRKIGFSISHEGVKEGLLKVRWLGRLQFVHGESPIVLDGSHNELALEVLLDSLRELNGFSRIFVVFSAMRGKPIPEMLHLLSKKVEKIYLTPLNFPKGMPVDEMCNIVQSEGINCCKYNDLNTALEQAKIEANSDDIILVTGSLYLVSEVIRILRGLPPPPIDGRIDDCV